MRCGCKGIGEQHYWVVAVVDSDNEFVLFSSDEELTMALGSVDDAVFKVYIEQEIGESFYAFSSLCIVLFFRLRLEFSRQL